MGQIRTLVERLDEVNAFSLFALKSWMTRKNLRSQAKEYSKLESVVETFESSSAHKMT